MKLKQACIFGGGGCLGRHLAPRLVAAGYRCHVPTRRPHRQRDLSLLPGVVVRPVARFDDTTLTACCEGCELIVNLVGGDYETADRHGATVPLLTQHIVAAARNVGVTRVLQLSALGAAADHPDSAVLRAYGAAETIVLSTRLAATCFRPAPLFGRGDALFTRLAALVDRAPGMLPLPYPEARLAPVWVGDVAAALVRAIYDPETVGRCYDLCGPRVFSWRELVAYTAACRRRTVWVLGLDARWSARWSRMLERLPGAPSVFAPPVARDAIGCARRNGLLELGVHPTDLDVEVPRYLRVA